VLRLSQRAGRIATKVYDVMWGNADERFGIRMSADVPMTTREGTCTRADRYASQAADEGRPYRPLIP
jgi:hypothetical protein